MFTLYDPKEQRWPIKVWLENRDQLDETCLQQAKNLSNLPFARDWIALMPDTHSGFGMPIGGVLATEGFLVPNAVGVDIGCGMMFIQTNVPVDLLKRVDTPNGKLAQAMVGDILRNIPTGFEHHKKKQECKAVKDFAKENRERMMDMVLSIVNRQLTKHAEFTNVELSEPIHCHHNYASLEQHYGKKVWVHRKGAIRAAKGEWGIIPGAMGGRSFLVRGKGNPESFSSCSHGAGRLMSRTEAKERYSVQETLEDLNDLGVFWGKQSKKDVAEESRFSYKDLDFVIANELDLIQPIRSLQTLAVVKG